MTTNFKLDHIKIDVTIRFTEQDEPPREYTYFLEAPDNKVNKMSKLSLVDSIEKQLQMLYNDKQVDKVKLLESVNNVESEGIEVNKVVEIMRWGKQTIVSTRFTPTLDHEAQLLEDGIGAGTHEAIAGGFL